MMNIILKSICVLITLIFLSNCKKIQPPVIETPVTVNTEIQNGLPANPDKINGFFYASYVSGNIGSYPVNYFFSTFSDPGEDLYNAYNHSYDGSINGVPGNVDVGITVKLNDQVLYRQLGNSFVYYYTYGSTYTSYSTAATWSAAGNGSFKPINQTVPRGFPVAENFTLSSISRSQGLTLNLTDIASNYDSLNVSLEGGNYPYMAMKAYAGKVNTVNFTPGELTFLSVGTSCNLVLRVSNYSYMIVNSKIYLFELNRKIRLNAYVTI